MVFDPVKRNHSVLLLLQKTPISRLLDVPGFYFDTLKDSAR